MYHTYLVQRNTLFDLDFLLQDVDCVCKIRVDNGLFTRKAPYQNLATTGETTNTDGEAALMVKNACWNDTTECFTHCERRCRKQYAVIPPVSRVELDTNLVIGVQCVREAESRGRPRRVAALTWVDSSMISRKR